MTFFDLSNNIHYHLLNGKFPNIYGHEYNLYSVWAKYRLYIS